MPYTLFLTPSLYLTELCRLPETEDGEMPSIPPPDKSELATFFLSAPPMRGGEYLSPENLFALWLDLDLWTRTRISKSKIGLNGWLVKNAPLWHQVGRVCFHLAENKRDSDYPFAFLATYAPLRKLISPYLLRRLKTDKSIITDLPDKTEVNAYCGLSKKQAALYQSSVEELKETLAYLFKLTKRKAWKEMEEL